ncbi:hypothetical protein ADIWIN_0138 [Winogradskyella psychrotolerans RS-3]|uniref:Uncharacterized protein n=1 Tax=Winogradskyella psychrotolerans RS-3 TaxID=641526 RepID=S7X6T5_9FLAO|nr:hypothetical protein [Winogradskyella psychrotolerans]EPR74774.1 hypothetical protein ADIWIN_0138 [Winogradskyella psychrotolerans RS-3]
MKSTIVGKYFSVLGLNKIFKIQFLKFDFRGIGKSTSPYHSCHFNELKVIDHNTILLGTKGWQDLSLKDSSLIKLSTNDMSAEFLATPGSFIASHDILNTSDCVIVTESINESIGIFNKKTNETYRIQLPRRGYFIRGIAKTNKGYLVGFSPNRTLLNSKEYKKKDKKNAFIEHYNNDFTKVFGEVDLDNFYPEYTGSAIHNIVQCD